MKKISKLLFVFAIALGFFAPAIMAQTTASPIKREMRSIWVAALGVDYGASTLKSVVDETVTMITENNYTSMCFHARPMADALYKSNLAPWSEYASGTRGKDPGYDPLQYAIDKAHAAGIELYAWLNPYRWQNGTTLSYNTTYDQQWKANGWAMTNDTQTVFNPGIPEVRAHIVAIVKEIIENYNVDGIIFDDYFYPSGGYTTSSDAVDYTLWKNSNSGLTFADWRRDNINKMVQDVYNVIQEIKPDVRFGISPAGIAGANASEYGFPSRPSGTSDWQYDKIYSDPLAWFHYKSIDFISPQVYWARSQSNAPFEALSKWWSTCAGMSDRHMYVSQGPYQGFSNEENVAQIEINRQYTQNNAPGFIMFSQKSMTNKLNEYILANATQNRVLQPEVTWHTDKEYAFSAPTNAKKSGSTLSWDAQSHSNRIVKYSVYAIPSSIEYAQAKSNDGDGISSEYLLGITYSPQYTIPEGKTSNYWYAICVYDGFSNEWDPAFVNLAVDPAPATTLTTPADGATVSGIFSLNWENVAVDSYVVEISASSDFATTVFNKNVTTNSVSVTASEIGEGTYYWRVTTKKDGYISTTTAARTMKIEIAPAPATTLTTPADGETVKGVFTLSWANASVDSYTVEVSSSSNFATTLYSKTVTETSVSIDAVSLGEGTYYWRVLTNKTGYKPNPTTARSFKIASIPSAAVATLTAPANNSVVEGGFSFSWTNAGVDSYTLQVSGTSNFTSIIYSTTTTGTSIDQTAEFFGRGTFYWRVMSHTAGCKDSYSAVNSFKIEKIATGEYEDGYIIKTDGYTYPNLKTDETNSISMTNSWIRATSLGNFSQEGDPAGTLNRDFVVVGDYVYISGRVENNQNSEIYLAKYDRYTGEHIGDIALSTSGQAYYYPCNNVMKDSKGTVCISNLTIDIASRPLYIHKVNLETGALTLVAELSSSSFSSQRIDHCEIYGDVESGNFYVFAPTPNASKVIRWTIENGELAKTEITTIGQHYPTSSSFGIAPIIIPMSSTDFFVDGQLTSLTRYTFKAGGTATLVDSFKNASYNGVPSQASYYNGGVVFDFAGEKYIGFTSTVVTNQADVTEDHQFDIVKKNSSMDYNSMELAWSFPGNFDFGNHNATTKQAPMDYMANADGSGSIYVYVPGAGIAAYTIKKVSSSGIEETLINENAPVEYYNLQGLKVINPANGIYIRVQGGKASKILVK